MTLLTIWALYIEDLRLLLMPMSVDDIFSGITLFAMLCFGMEICIGSYSKEDYIYSFFFWLDIISTLSMIPDVSWIWNVIIGDSGGSEGAEDATDIAKNSRVGRVVRIVRIVRLIRLFRIAKLYKETMIAR